MVSEVPSEYSKVVASGDDFSSAQSTTSRRFSRRIRPGRSSFPDHGRGQFRSLSSRSSMCPDDPAGARGHVKVILLICVLVLF